MLNAQLGQLYSTIAALDAEAVAVAFSGGGDSTALLHALRDTAKVTHAFIIDHNLRQESASETDRAAGFALDLGYNVSVRRWDHNNPQKGLQVKAREYRYAAMGELCRQLDITHLLTAHTEDDQAETLLMRQERGTGWRGLAGMKADAYGPLWPGLAEVRLVRPLLNVSRQALRDYNKEENLSWIEDPSNENQDFTRVRAREKLAKTPALKSQLLNLQAEQVARLFSERQDFKTWVSNHAVLHPHGFIELKAVPPSELMLHILRFASGSGGPIDSARREALCQTMTQKDFKASTLAGAWVVKTQDSFLVTREKVAISGRKETKKPDILPQIISDDRPHIWDGRFLIQSNLADIQVVPAGGLLQQLRQRVETKDMFSFPEHVRPTLPVYMKGGDIIGFGAGKWPELSSECLIQKRFTALWV